MATDKKTADKKPAPKKEPKKAPEISPLELHIRAHVGAGRTVTFAPTSGRKKEVLISISTPGKVGTKKIKQARRKRVEIREEQPRMKPAKTDAGHFQTLKGDDGKLRPLMEPVWATHPETGQLILDEEGFPQQAFTDVLLGVKWEETTETIQVAEIGPSETKTATIAMSEAATDALSSL